MFINNGEDGNLEIFMFGYFLKAIGDREILTLNPGVYTIYSNHKHAGGGVIKVLGVYGAVGAGNPGDIWEVV